MRKIDKGAPMPSFTGFVSQHHPSRWEDARDVSHTWREYILEYEQYRLSGNFIVDSKNETYGEKHKEHVVRTREENEKLINPATEDASRFFKYELNGRVTLAEGLSDKDRARADYTMAAFNLNESSLVERRRVIINTMMEPYQDLTDDIIMEALADEGFTSVVEQLLRELKTGADTL